jgi:hypothetical protein
MLAKYILLFLFVASPFVVSSLEDWEVVDHLNLRANLEMDDRIDKLVTHPVVKVKDPAIFGLDLLGWGVDLRLGKPEEAIKVPIFSRWTYAENQTYLYPLEPETPFHVPDEVYVRTVAEIYSTNYLFDQVDSYTEFLGLKLGLGIRKDAQNSTGSSGGGSGNSSVPGGSAVNLAAFSGDIEVSYQNTKLSQGTNVIVVNSLESGLWQLVAGPALPVRARVTAAINETLELANGSPPDDEAYARFINRHGTHYIESVIVGGILQMSSTIRTSTLSSKEKINVIANFQFQKLFGLDQGNVNFDLNITNDANTFTREANNWMKALGGDPELANFFSGTLKPNETFVMWQETLISNPAVIRYRLRETSWLFPRQYRKTVSDAVKLYITGTPAF